MHDTRIARQADKANAYQVKEGTEFHVQIFFKVNGEVVSGLKYVLMIHCNILRAPSTGACVHVTLGMQAAVLIII